MTGPMRRAACALVSLALLWLGACAEPNIVLQPALPATATPAPQTHGTVVLTVTGTGANARAGKYEEEGSKVYVGNSESLGVHLSDIWLGESPARFVRRLLESDLRSLGYEVLPGRDAAHDRVEGYVNRFSITSRAINPVQFQADGVIDIDVSVNRSDGARLYKGHYVGTCMFRTATEIPNQTNLGKLLGRCVDDLQRHLHSDASLRAALSAH